MTHQDNAYAEIEKLIDVLNKEDISIVEGGDLCFSGFYGSIWKMMSSNKNNFSLQKQENFLQNIRSLFCIKEMRKKGK